MVPLVLLPTLVFSLFQFKSMYSDGDNIQLKLCLISLRSCGCFTEIEFQIANIYSLSIETYNIYMYYYTFIMRFMDIDLTY